MVKAVSALVSYFFENFISLDEPAVSLLPYLNATQGSVIMLNCEVTGYPDPTVTWYKDSSLLATDDRVMVHNDSVVVINNAFSTDSGIYTCSAANVAGNSSASTELTVLGKEREREGVGEREGRVSWKSTLFRFL